MIDKYISVEFGDTDNQQCAHYMLPKTRCTSDLTSYYEGSIAAELDLTDPTDDAVIVKVTPLKEVPPKVSAQGYAPPAPLSDEAEFLSALHKMAAVRLMGKHLPTGAARRDAVQAIAGILLRDNTPLEDIERCISLIFQVAEDSHVTLFLPYIKECQKRLNAGDSVAGRPILSKLASKEVADAFVTWVGIQPTSGASDPMLLELDGKCASMHQNDIGNAERFVTRFGHNVRYCHCWATWLVWTGEMWAKDADGQLMRWGRETVLCIYREIATIPQMLDGKGRDLNQGIRDALAQHAKKSGMHARLEAMLKQAQSHQEVSVTAKQLDSHAWLYNTPSGTLDVRTGRTTEHRREDLITKIAPISYDAEARCAIWQTFLRRVLPDAEVRDYVQRAVGYTLTGRTSEQCLFFLFGHGRNGKSTFLEVVLALMGIDVYATKARAELIMVKRSDRIPNDIAALCGARLVSVAEIGDGQRLDEALIKDLTGGDTMQGRFLYKEWFSFMPSHKLWLYGNHKPLVRGTDMGIWRRIKLVPFEVTIPVEEVDPELPDKLRRELPGILNWAVEGCRLWQSDGLREPEAVKVATTEYRTEMDTLNQFVEDRCEQGPGNKVGNSALHAAYKEWCVTTGEYQMTQTKFSRSLKERGFEQGKSGARFWIGIELSETVETWRRAGVTSDLEVSPMMELIPVNW